MRYVYLILSIVVLFTGLTAIGKQDRHLDLRRIPGRLDITTEQLDYIAEQLCAYHRATGRYPSNSEGLLRVRSVAKDCAKGESRFVYTEKRLRITESGVLSIWGEPFVYENRRGIDRSRFAGSGADDSDSRHYSVRVDDGIYVWSIAGRDAWRTYTYWTPRLKTRTRAVRVISATLLLAYVIATVRAIGRGHTGLERAGKIAWSLLGGGLIAVALSALLFPGMVSTCYESTILRYRTPKLTEEYLALISKYRDSGVISDAAYKKITRTLERR